MLENIQYCIKPANLAWALVAHSEQGICAILINQDKFQLLSALAARFPSAKLCPADITLEQLTEQLVKAIDHPKAQHNFRLDLRGTDFQRSVWQVIQAIPFGHTLSYQAIAEQLNKPSAARAVARACGANAHAVLIPCHRVIRKTGKLSGYRWGVPLKQALLNLELNSQTKTA